MWEDDSPAFRFIQKLTEQRYAELCTSDEFLSKLRYDWDLVKTFQNTFSDQLARDKTSMAELVIRASENVRTSKCQKPATPVCKKRKRGGCVPGARAKEPISPTAGSTCRPPRRELIFLRDTQAVPNSSELIKTV